MSALSKLVSTSVAIRAEPYDARGVAGRFGSKTAKNLGPLLELANGFYAFEQALHVFADVSNSNEKGLFDWNNETLWRRDYDGMADNAVFFAEDVFGTQFCIREGGVATFDPETGRFEKMAADVEAWAGAVCEDYQFWTGHKVAHEWQAKHGSIALGARLIPKVPFVLGGEYSTENLHPLEAVKAMRYRASIAVQIRDLPDGSPVVLHVGD
jgi:hypothetical protein